MNKWSKSLQSITALSNDAKFNIDPMLIQNPLPSPNDDTDSLTDVSMITQTQPSPRNYDQTSTYNNKSKPVVEIDNSRHNQFIPTGALFQSLVDYANSFSFDETVYSKQDLKKHSQSNSSIKQQTQPLSSINNKKLTRHKSCGDLTLRGISIETIKQDPTQLIRSHIYSTRKTERDDNDKHSDESTTITDGSKFQWEYLSDSIGHSKKSSNDRSNNYQLTTQIDQINSHYSQDFDQLLSGNFSQKISPSSIIIREKTQDLFIQQNIDIQFVRPSTPVSSRAGPIIIQEVLHKPNQSNPQHHLPRSSTTAFAEHDRSSKPPIGSKRRSSIQPQQPRKIIIEYDQVNVSVAKNINQRKEIKRVHPKQYIEQHRSSLYPNSVFHQLLTNIIS